MKPRTRIPARRQKPRRVRGREKLYGKAKEARRLEIFERSGGFCEEIIPRSMIDVIKKEMGMTHDVVRCMKRITWETMEWSHNRHGSNKDDSLSGGIASCKECHQRRHNPKSVPKKCA